MLADASSSGSNTPALVALVIAVIALVGTITTAIVGYLGISKTANVAREANTNARVAAEAAAALERREEWWKRVQWAMERACDGKTAQARKVGVDLLRALKDSQLAHEEDKKMIAQIYTVVASGASGTP
jgi:hypothetical protein